MMRMPPHERILCAGMQRLHLNRGMGALTLHPRPKKPGSPGETIRMSATEYRVQGGVAVISHNNPPVNGLGHDLRSGIVAGLDKANADPKVKAIVLIGSDKVANRTFSGGADIREFNTPKMTMEPTLHTIIGSIENNAKPVIAAIGGNCMGGGLELALGCHFRG